MVQADLTQLWTLRIPIVQRVTPAELVASMLIRVLGPKTLEYTYVDFCSGAGGPTPIIEKELNKQLQLAAESRKEHASSAAAQFLLTDLHPHIKAWKSVAERSPNLGYIPEPVNATSAPKDLLDGYIRSQQSQKQLRLFSLAFHHFPDHLAIAILENALETSDGFAILELTPRDLPSLMLMALVWPLLLVITPFYFASDPIHLFWTYVLPIVPFVVVFDGFISTFRVRTPSEVFILLRKAAARVAARQRRGSTTGESASPDAILDDEVGGHLLLRDWDFMSGSEMHSPPLGKMSWILCVKDNTTEGTGRAAPGVSRRQKNRVTQTTSLDIAALRRRVKNQEQTRERDG